MSMNGAESLVRTLVGAGVDVCFTNPGTSEMHFVAALDRVEGMRCVLGLFEGVVTAAADGYARMSGRPASTLLHLGPGLANGFANLHNARKAQTPVVNVVGDHATYHLRYDAPLTSDIEGIAGAVSSWVRTSPDAASVARDGAEAIAAARTHPGGIATLILPADTAWNESDGPVAAVEPLAPAKIGDDRLEAVARVLESGEPSALYMTGDVLLDAPLRTASRIANATGVRLLGQTANGRLERGAGRVPLARLPYPIDQAVATLADLKHIVLLGTRQPVGFFAYPGKPSVLAPEGCEIHVLTEAEEDGVDALERLAERLGATASEPTLQAAAAPPLPDSDDLSIDNICQVIGAMLPEQAIVVDEAITTGRGLHPFTVGAAPHDWLQICGGAIGIGIPLAAGAAVACPDRKVVDLQADGSAMYTLQGLWTQAREGLDVTTLVFSNRSYAILRHELANVGAANPGRKALDMLSLSDPDLDWVSMARGMGVDAVRVNTVSELVRAFGAGLAAAGPSLVEVAI